MVANQREVRDSDTLQSLVDLNMKLLDSATDVIRDTTDAYCDLRQDRDALLAALKDVISSWERELRAPWAVDPKIEAVHAVELARELIAKVEDG